MEIRDTAGDSWFSLFFWPAFRRIFTFGKKSEVARERPEPRSRATDLQATKPAEKVAVCAVPQVIIETQIEHWICVTLESNVALVAALKRLQGAYNLIQAGKTAKDSEKILAQVEAALQNVERVRM